MKGQTFTTMDGLRGVAALMVVAFHTRAGADLLPGAYLAVDMFFALSGFVLAHTSVSKLANLRSALPFLVKRIIRLYPLYAIGLVLGVFAYTYTSQIDANFWPSALAINLALNAAFLPSLPAYEIYHWAAYPINPPAWSLAFEIFVNVVLGLTAFLLTTHRLSAIIALSAIAFIASSLILGSLGGSTLSTFLGGFPRVIFSFFVGIAVYRIWASGVMQFSVPWWVSIGGLVFLLSFPVPAPYRLFGDLAVVLLIFPAILATATGTQSLPILQFFGRISYAVYIVHMPIMHLIWAASEQFLTVDLNKFGLLGTIILLVLVVIFASMLDPLDAAFRRRITTLAARQTWWA